MLNGNHVFLIKIIGGVLVALLLVIGIVILEYQSYVNAPKEINSDICSVESQINATPVQNGSLTSSSAETLEVNQSKGLTASHLPFQSVEGIEKSTSDDQFKTPLEDDEACAADEEPFKALSANKRETMCSIQDLLANTSAMNTFYDLDNSKKATQNESLAPAEGSHSDSSHNTDAQSRLSINEVGLPVSDNRVTSSAHNSYSNNDTTDSGKIPSKESVTMNSILKRNSSFLSSSNNSSLLRTNGMVSNHKKENYFSNSLDANKGGTVGCLETARNTNPASKEDYENIYDAVPNEISSPPQILNPRALFLPHRSHESSVAQSSSSHDYENLPALNVYRASTGVRHWKTYLDIEDEVHDYSTFKERSAIQDSTLASNLYANTLILTEMSPNLANSNSVSLPDLSNIGPSACIELERVSKFVESQENSVNINKPQEEKEQGSVIYFEDPSNYEAIWYDDIDEGNEAKCNSSARIRMGPDGNIKESLCNLYYSKLSDLSTHNNPHTIKRNNSLSSLQPSSVQKGAICNMELSQPHLFIEINNPANVKQFPNDVRNNTSLPNGMSTPNTKCRRSNSKLTQKSPLMRLVSLSQNSLHEHTVKAFKAGKRVFYRPRVHVITPKKEVNNFPQRIRIPNRQTHLNYGNKIDPNVLKKRGQLSPKDKLILSEASVMIHRRDSAAGCKTSLGFHAEAPAQEVKQISGNDGLCDSTVKDEGPQHSTPEGNRRLPQMSILSTISSVASPEESVKVGLDSCFSNRSVPFNVEISNQKGNSEYLISGKRSISKHLTEMSVIEEMEAVPLRV